MLLALTFHYSSIIMIFIYFINPRKLNRIFYMSLPVIGMIFCYFNQIILKYLFELSKFLPIIFSEKIDIYLSLLENGKDNHLNLLNFYYTFLLLMYYFLIFNYKKFSNVYDTLYIKILGIALFCFYALSVIPVFAFRISEFLSVIIIFLIPDIVYKYKEKIMIFSFIFIILSIYFIKIMILRNLHL